NGASTLLRYNGFATTPIAINNAGDAVGSFNDGSHTHGFVYSHANYATPTVLDAPGAVNTVAGTNNNAGEIGGYYTDSAGTATAFKTIALTVDPVADQPAVSAFASAIGTDGSNALFITLSNAAELFEDGDDTVTLTVTLSNGATLSQTGGGALVTANGNGIFS